MPKSISESVIVITGASSGIGRATALAVAAQKGAVVIASRQEAAINEVAQECERMGGQALAVRADVTDEKQVLHLAARAIDRFGRIDAWVNAAAVTLLSGFEDAPSDVFRRVFETNFFGYVNGARAALAQFREQKHGVLINIAAVLGKMGAPYASAYSASKFAVTGFSESLRMELRNDPDIHVCTVFPATVDTPLYQHAANYTGRAVAAPPPVYQPEDVAAAILRCVVRPAREVTVGNVRSTLAMRMSENTYASKVHKDHFQERPAPASHGNLFDSMPSYNTVHGGWSGGREPWRRKTWYAAATLAAGLGIVAVCLARQKRMEISAARVAGLASKLRKTYALPLHNGHMRTRGGEAGRRALQAGSRLKDALSRACRCG
jgi:NAD(P)-dependent dehydrogenase (short-subunit alcohol dehydrogenase family)